jgi:hypothetical protein
MKTLLFFLLSLGIFSQACGQIVPLSAADWLAEFENPSGSHLRVGKDMIEVVASAGATVWYKKQLSGNLIITYNVTVVDSGGRTDRVSDLNAFWMASDPAQANPFTRDGKFPSYDNMDLYYAGVGGHDNTTTRFRRYRHGTDKSILQEYTDKEHLLKGNKTYAVKITVQDGRTAFFIDGVQYFDYVDPKPLTEGYFAFRTTKSRERISNFAIEALSPKSSKQLTVGDVASSDSLALDNEYFRVLKNFAGCTSAHTPNFGTRVIVALNHVRFESSKGTVTLERGKIAVFLAHESYKSPTGEFFEVAFKANHPPVKGPEQWLEPEKNTVVYEDGQFRVFEERLAAHGERQLHSHAQRLVVRLNLVQLTDPRYFPEGTPGAGIQVPNTVKYAEPIIHVVRNLSDIPLFNIVIEFKVPQ